MGLKISQMTAAIALLGNEEIELSQLSTTVLITAATISALASDNSFNDSAAGFLIAGFAVGQTVKVQGFTGSSANNIHSATITSLTASKMIIAGTDGDVIVDDAAGESVTITKWSTVRTSKNAFTPNVGTPATPVDFKDSVLVATTANISLTGEQTIDGVLTSASRVLVRANTAGATNGIYVSAAGAWSRATDADLSSELTSGMMLYVESGTVNGGQVFILTTPDPIVLGTTVLTFLATAVPISAFVGKTVSGTTYTHDKNDSGKRLNCTNAGTKTITIAPQSSVNSAVNTEIEVFNAGAGLLTLAPGAGVTLNSAGLVLTVSQYQCVRLKKRANPNTWDVTGVTSANVYVAARYTLDLASQADGDPGVGKLRFNNASPASATKIFLDDETSDAVDMSTAFLDLGSSGYIRIQAVADADEWLQAKWTAIVDDTGYFDIAITVLASKGTLDDTDAVVVTFDAKGITGSTQGKHQFYIDAASMSPSVTGGCAALARIASAASQPDIVSLNFDPTTQEYAQFKFKAPKSSDETAGFKFVPVWSHAATTVNFGVVWDVQMLAIGDNEATAQAFGTAQTSTDTGGTTNNKYIGPESATITPAGTWAEGDILQVRVSRVTGNGSDTMAIDARLEGIEMSLTTNAETDA